MTLRSAVLALAVAILVPVTAGAKIPSDRTLASLAPSRALDEARAASETHAVHEEGAATSAIAERLARVEERLTRLEEADGHQLRARDNLIQARFEETDRKIIEVVGRLQIFVGCLIVLLLAIFVWLAELARRGQAVSASPVATPARRRSARSA